MNLTRHHAGSLNHLKKIPNYFLQRAVSLSCLAKVLLLHACKRLWISDDLFVIRCLRRADRMLPVTDDCLLV